MDKYFYNSKPLLNNKVIRWFEELGFEKTGGNTEETYEYFTLKKGTRSICIEISRKYIHIFPSKKCANKYINRFTIDNTKTSIINNLSEIERRFLKC